MPLSLSFTAMSLTAAHLPLSGGLTTDNRLNRKSSAA
jgi:hypothetical protein